LKTQLLSANKVLSASKTSLNPVMAMIHIVKHILNTSIYNLVELKTGFVFEKVQLKIKIQDDCHQTAKNPPALNLCIHIHPIFDIFIAGIFNKLCCIIGG